uniref:FAS1 domain-containing protein n=1 Tax=Kalanchoe fedtschenkoi TaxID=63787 RepID=A0A7N0URJ8_KALFE
MAAMMITVAALLFLSTSASAFNITRILAEHPEFGAFNDLLTKTHLSSEINSRATITILAVADDSIGAISGKPLDVQKRILSNHVVLDYYDAFKLRGLKKSSLLTTLYQSTGLAERQQGFLNISVTSSGIAFGSAVEGSPLSAKLLGGIMSQPYNISVLQVSSPIVAPGMDPSEPLPPIPSPTPPAAETPEAASPEEEETVETPAESPAAESPEADAPAPADAPAEAKKKHKAADEEEEEPESSSAGQISGGLAVVVGLVCCLVA